MLKVADFSRASSATSNAQQPDSDEDSEPELYCLPQGNQINRPSQYPNLPRLGEEKALVGPTDHTTGEVKIAFRSRIDQTAEGIQPIQNISGDRFKLDVQEAAAMEDLGLPTGFRFGATPGRQDKTKKKTFYCQICLLELNSEDTMKSHVAGVKHMKKKQMLNLQKGENGEETPSVIPIPNPLPTKVKIPIRLHNKIRESREPVIGLDYVREFIPESDPEMEPYYRCEICGSQGIANGMFSHLMGLKHRQMVIERHFDDGHHIGLNQMECLKIATKLAENNCNLGEKIRCFYSDLDYPWPPEKAPWARERGGSGIAPPGAVQNFGRDDVKGGIVLGPGPPALTTKTVLTGSLPAPAAIPPPRTKENASRYLAVAQRLVQLVVDAGVLSGPDLSLYQAQVLTLSQRLAISETFTDRDPVLGRPANPSPQPGPSSMRLPESALSQGTSSEHRVDSPQPGPSQGWANRNSGSPSLLTRCRESRSPPSDGRGVRDRSRSPDKRLMGASSYSPELRAEIMREVLEERMAPSQVAKKYSMSPHAIRDWIKKSGQSLPKTYNKKQDYNRDNSSQL